MSGWLRVRSRFDRVLAAFLLVPAAPVIALCAWFVHRHDGGPGLLTVPRVGRNGRQIRMWKVRSMRIETPDGRAGGAALTSVADDRVTPVGARLRSYHLDELPQLWNVVRGDMTLLGPRPEAPEFVDVADPAWQAVLAVAPGIAGPTQLIVGDWEQKVISRAPAGDAYAAEVVPVKLAIDGWYVRLASPTLDAKVVLALLRHVLPGADSRSLPVHVRAAVPELAQMII